MKTREVVDGEAQRVEVVARAARRRRQYLAAAVVNIVGFMSGVAYGWNAPILPLLQSENSPLGIPPITELVASWLASVINLTRIFATPVFMYVDNRYGHKITGYVIAAACFISWAMLLFANSILILISSRVIIGFASGGIVLLVPAFVSDFAEDDIKGRLAAFFGLSMNLGATFSYAMGCYTPYLVYHVCCLLVPVVFAAAFFWLPESPSFLMAQGKDEEARMSLRWFRNGQEREFELERLRARAREVLKKRHEKFMSCTYDKPTMRALCITIGLLTNKQLSGVTVITTYTVTIFQQSGSTISPDLSTIVIGVLLTLGTLLSTVLIEKAGRRPLLMYSDLFIGACLAAVGTFLYLKDVARWHVEPAGWVPLACLSMYILGMSLALGPLTFTISTEMVASHARAAVQTACSVYGALVAFATALAFAPLGRALGQHGVFWLFSAVCFVGSACVFLLMPETKNRSVEDVVWQLGGDHYVRSVVRGHRTALPKTAAGE